VQWIVTWGTLMRPNFHSVHVEAFDPDDALVVARSLHPELPPPRTAFRSAPVAGPSSL
jgi:hypothetical protein